MLEKSKEKGDRKGHRRIQHSEFTVTYFETMALYDEEQWRTEDLDPTCWINAIREQWISLNVAWHPSQNDFRVYFARHFLQHKDEWTSGER